MAKIIYTNDNGNVVVVTPVSTELTVDEIAAKDVPAGKSYTIVEDAQVPTDRSFRDAWALSDGSIQVDMTKAKDLMRDKIREVRKDLLASEDVEFMRAVETANAYAQAASAARKQALRDAPSASAISNASDVTALKAAWDTSLLGVNPYI
tara:strand:+ start:568 stop:1017 length:450 start_codon:yes stop_codon:yes gene_type:complete